MSHIQKMHRRSRYRADQIVTVDTKHAITKTFITLFCCSKMSSYANKVNNPLKNAIYMFRRNGNSMYVHFLRIMGAQSKKLHDLQDIHLVHHNYYSNMLNNNC